ncbi:cupin [Agaribacter marinus]|uniref:Cupin n=2 Tax=Agaribacter marinus TaxID=1431249 RepID=A0AA37T348_9ALTE|nr:cupin [Agaribacter marinus]
MSMQPKIKKRVDEYPNVSTREFFEEIVPMNKPVILKGLVNDWPVLKKAKESSASLHEYLTAKSINTTHTVRTFEAPKSINGRYFYNEGTDKYNFKEKDQSFAQAIKTIFELTQTQNQELSVYTGSIGIFPHVQGFIEENPHPFQLNSKIEPRFWLGNSSTVSTHYDEFDNIACLVSGKRTFTLFPTEQVKNLYPGPIDKSPAGAPMSMVDIDNPNFDKHPRYKDALEHALVAELAPGDGFYNPPLWWHNVRSEGDYCMLVNYFWLNDNRKLESPINTLLHGLYTLSHLSEAERKNWKYLIDYFVFKAEGEPLAHLNEAERGIFRKIDPQHAYDIRDYMLRNMGVDLGKMPKGQYSDKFK